MVIKRYLNEKFVKPLEEHYRAEGLAEVRAERMLEDWLRRRSEAEQKGVSFNEPPPTLFMEQTKTAAYGEAYAKGYSDGYSEGRIHGMWEYWYSRRMKAEAKGIPFDEPRPSP